MNANDESFSEDDIAAVAKQIWDREGRPEGKAEEHWARAREQLSGAQDEQALADPGEKTGTAAAD